MKGCLDTLQVKYWELAKLSATFKYVIRCVIWQHLYNLKNVKNTHGVVLILVKLQAEACNFILKLTLLHGYFSLFQNCTNATKWRNAAHIAFAGENGVDAGALKIEFFTKICKIARKELFEHPYQCHVVKYLIIHAENLKYLKHFESFQHIVSHKKVRILTTQQRGQCRFC